MTHSPSTPNTYETVGLFDPRTKRIEDQQKMTRSRLMKAYEGAWELTGDIAAGTAEATGTTVVLAGEAIGKTALGLGKGIVRGVQTVLSKRNNAA